MNQPEMKRIALTLLLLAGCTHTPQDQNIALWSQRRAEVPKIQFLGVGGWLISWKNEQLLFAPFFSNTPLYKLPFNTIPDIDKINESMPAVPQATMMLVGHGHYDHLLDVIHIATRQARGTTIYGSENVKHILSAKLPDKRVVNVEPDIGPKFSMPGKWTISSGGRFRAMPLRSQHAPHFLGIHLVPEDGYKSDLQRLPRSAWTWKAGQPIAWLVDLLDEQKRPLFRIHYQDSSATPPYGFPPVLMDGKVIDLEILCAGNWEQVRDYPKKLLQVTQPKMVLIGHWENFFDGDINVPKIIPLLDLRGLINTVRLAAPQATVIVPAPLSEISLSID